MSPEELTRFTFLMGELVGNIGEQYREVTYGILPERDVEHPYVILSQFLRTPGGQKFWQQFATSYSKDFREFVQQRVLGDT